jgi:hypothetical protein
LFKVKGYEAATLSRKQHFEFEAVSVLSEDKKLGAQGPI